MTHYLDDFFFVDTPDSVDFQRMLASFRELMADLGVPMAEKKTVGPDTVLAFLGIEIDSMTMQARLPEDKRAAMLLMLTAMLAKEKVRVREVQVLLGQLNFACRLIQASRTFCRKLGLALSGLSLPH